MRKLTAVIESASSNFAAYLNEVDGIIGIGDTIEETKDSLEKCIRYCIEDCEEDGIDVPEPLVGDFEIEYKYPVKHCLEDVYEEVNWAYLAKNYFGKRREWLFHKFYEEMNGRDGFSDIDRDKLKDALCDIAQRIKMAADRL